MLTQIKTPHDRVFYWFEELSKIPRGSGYMKDISEWCANFAKTNGLDYYRDSANNVIIYKNGTGALKETSPIILQSHLDMVWQKDGEFDFFTQPVEVINDGEYISAKSTTLGADNGIGVAMILSILESKELVHPPIEAVFTTDEEIGMVGALQLDFSRLSAKRMINLDSEEEDTLTVSCAGGSDFSLSLPLVRKAYLGTPVILTLSQLLGGHSGVEIDKGRVNSNTLASRVLNHLRGKIPFELVSVNGGDKINAIPRLTEVILMTSVPDRLTDELSCYLDEIKAEISAREPNFDYSIDVSEESELSVIESSLSDRLIFFLLNAPNGIMEMSYEIKGLVETSLNLGILKTLEDFVEISFSLRSNKPTALDFLEEKLASLSKCLPARVSVSGRYPAWKYKNDSELRKIYSDLFEIHFSKKPKIEAIHAGLECGVFSEGIEGLDCIAMGPNLFDIHTTKERADVMSVKRTFSLLCDILSKLN